jgi:hypothetical protein
MFCKMLFHSSADQMQYLNITQVYHIPLTSSRLFHLRTHLVECNANTVELHKDNYNFFLIL